MPLARVRTALSTLPHELQQQLLAAGYDIELVRPMARSSTAADLELILETLPVRKALNTAKDTPENIYVAPGTLLTKAQESPRPIRVPTNPPALKNPSTGADRIEHERHVAEQQILVQRRAEQQRIEQDRLRREQQEIEQQRREQQRSEQLRAEQLQMEELRRREERARREQAKRESNEHLQAEQDRNARLQAERDRVEAESREQERVLQMWREAEAREQQRAAKSKADATRLEAERLEHERQAEVRRQAELAEAQRLAEIRAEQERETRTREEARRRWEAEQATMQAEEERLRLELQRKQEELRAEQNRIRRERERFERDRLIVLSSDARLAQHETASPNVIPISAAAVSNTDASSTPEIIPENVAAAPASQPSSVERRKQPRFPLLEGGARRLRHREYRRAAMVAASLTAVVMALWVTLSTRHPASPLPTSQLVQTAGMEQVSPFGPAKLNAPVEIGKQPTQAAPEQQPVPAAQKPSAGNASAKSALKPVAAKPAPRKKTRGARKTNTEDQEVVVRHFGTRAASATPKKAVANKDGVKVFSDMN